MKTRKRKTRENATSQEIAGVDSGKVEQQTTKEISFLIEQINFAYDGIPENLEGEARVMHAVKNLNSRKPEKFVLALRQMKQGKILKSKPERN